MNVSLTRAAFVVLPLACLAAPALAVGGLAPMEEEPNKGNVLTVAPPEVSLEFGADINPAKTGFTVTDAHGTNVGMDGSRVSKDDPRMLTVGLKPTLGPGVYTVRWHAVAPDGQKTHGSYSFTVQHAEVLKKIPGGT